MTWLKCQLYYSQAVSATMVIFGIQILHLMYTCIEQILLALTSAWHRSIFCKCSCVLAKMLSTTYVAKTLSLVVVDCFAVFSFLYPEHTNSVRPSLKDILFAVIRLRILSVGQ